jgi:hypothetical protein
MKRMVLSFVVFTLFLTTACGGGGLSGTYANEKHDNETYTFSGKTYTYTFEWEDRTTTVPMDDTPAVEHVVYRKDQEQGEYSISGDEIEMIDSDGVVKVYSFSRTENTIVIDGTRYVKR